jgi:hypothetical protein
MRRERTIVGPPSLPDIPGAVQRSDGITGGSGRQQALGLGAAAAFWYLHGVKNRLGPVLGVLLLAAAAHGAGKKEVTVGDLHPISSGSVEPAAAEAPRLRGAKAPADGPETPVEEKVKAPAEPKVGFGRKLKPMRRTRLKAVDLLKDSQGQGRPTAAPGQTQ